MPSGGLPAPEKPPAPARVRTRFIEGPFVSAGVDGREVVVLLAKPDPLEGDDALRYLVGYDAATRSLLYAKLLKPSAVSDTPTMVLGTTSHHVIMYASGWNIWSYVASTGEPIGSARLPEYPTDERCARPNGMLIGLGERRNPRDPPVFFDPWKLSVTPDVDDLSYGCLRPCKDDAKAALCVPLMLFEDNVDPPGKTVSAADKVHWRNTRHEFVVRGADDAFAVGYRSSGTNVPFAMRFDEKTMKVRWKVELPGDYDSGARFSNPPRLVDGLLVVPYERYPVPRIVALALESGAIVWEHPMKGHLPLILGERIYGRVSPNDSDNIPVADLRTGKSLGTILAPTL